MDQIYNNTSRSDFKTESLPLVLTVPEAAKKLRIGLGRCYELTRCGQLRSIGQSNGMDTPMNGGRQESPRVMI